MDNEGANLLAGVRYVRSFFEDIAKLIGSADDMMKASQWQRLTNWDVVFGEYSQTVKYPRWWMPFELVRFYTSDECKGLLLGVSVIIDDRDDPKLLTEPLVSGIIVNYGKEADIGYWNWPYGSLHISMPDYLRDVTNDGRLLTAPFSALSGVMRECRTVTSFALPLLEITDSESLSKKVVLPLLAAAKEIHGSSPAVEGS